MSFLCLGVSWEGGGGGGDRERRDEEIDPQLSTLLTTLSSLYRGLRLRF